MLYALLVLYDTRVVFAPPAETPAAGADGESARRLARPWLARSAVAPAHASADASVAAADVAAAGNKVPPPAPPPGQPQRWRLRLRADMFSNFDGIVPYTIARRWDC